MVLHDLLAGFQSGEDGQGSLSHVVVGRVGHHPDEAVPHGQFQVGLGDRSGECRSAGPPRTSSSHCESPPASGFGVGCWSAVHGCSHLTRCDRLGPITHSSDFRTG